VKEKTNDQNILIFQVICSTCYHIVSSILQEKSAHKFYTYLLLCTCILTHPQRSSRESPFCDVHLGLHQSWSTQFLPFHTEPTPERSSFLFVFCPSQKIDSGMQGYLPALCPPCRSHVKKPEPSYLPLQFTVLVPTRPVSHTPYPYQTFLHPSHSHFHLQM
jgi:hypothetical protein